MKNKRLKIKNLIKRNMNIMKNKRLKIKNLIKRNMNIMKNKIKLYLEIYKNKNIIKKYKQEEEKFLKKMKKKPKDSFCFIHHPKTHNFDIDDNIKKNLFSKNIKVCFKYSVHKQSWSEYSSLWNSENVTYFNHVGRDSDSNEFIFCQKYVREILKDLQLSNADLNSVLQIMKETIVLQSADYYALVLRYLTMIDEICKKEKYKKILIVGIDIKFSFALKFILQKHGFETFVVKPTSMTEKKYFDSKKEFDNNIFEKSLLIPRKNIDLESEINRLNKLCHNEEKNIILVPFRINDNVYFQSLAAVARQIKKYTFISIDRFNDEKTNKVLKDSQLSDNFNYFPISSKFAFLNDQDQRNLEIDLINYFKTSKSHLNSFKSYYLNEHFFIYGLLTIKNQLLRALFYYKIYSSVFISETKIKAILTSPSRTVEARATIEAANKNNILTLDLQGGTISASNRFWKTNAQYMLCFEKFSYTVYTEFFKLKKKDVFIVGSPRLDNDMLLYKKKRCLKKDKIKILIALQTLSSEINTKIVKTCEEAIVGLKNIEVYISFHPGDSISNRKKVIEEKDNSTIVSDKKTLEELLDTNICITYFSTIGLEAFALGCKVIALNIVNKDKWIFRLSDIGVAEEAYTSKELRNLILSKENKAEEKSFEVFRDGKSAERILNLIEQGK